MSSAIIASSHRADQRNDVMRAAAATDPHNNRCIRMHFPRRLSRSFSSNLTAALSGFERRQAPTLPHGEGESPSRATVIKGIKNASRPCIRPLCASDERHVPQGLSDRNHRGPQPDDFDCGPCGPMFRHQKQLAQWWSRRPRRCPPRLPASWTMAPCAGPQAAAAHRSGSRMPSGASALPAQQPAAR